MYPTDEFTDRTEKMIKQFQRDYMKDSETGKVCGYKKGSKDGWFSEDYSKGLDNRVTKCLNYEL